MKRGGFRYLPHFVAGDLGTEITYFSEEGQVSDKDWEARLQESNFSHDLVEEIKQTLSKKYEIALVPQTQHGFSRYKINYYYKSLEESTDKRALEAIRRLAREHGIGVNINRRNPWQAIRKTAMMWTLSPCGQANRTLWILYWINSR